MPAKKLTIAIFLFLALFLTSCNQKSLEKPSGSLSQTQKEKQSQEQEKESFTGSFLEALKLGKSMKCEWKKDANNFGKAWIKDKDYKSENTIDGKTSFIIHKNNCTYVWTNEENKGIKMCQQENDDEMEKGKEEMDYSQEGTSKQAEAWQKDFNYHCSTAVISSNQFALPANIQFTDPFAAMPSVPNMPDMPSMPGIANP